MKKLTLSGCGTALVTPFKKGKVDYEAYKDLVRRQVEAGIDFLVPLGSTAETPCLEDEEKIELLKITRETAPDLPLVVGCGTNSLQHTLRNIQMLEPYGPDVYLVVVPYYNKPTQEGMYQYFKEVAASTQKDILLYNVPGRTGANILPETVLRLAEIPNIAGIKEASGDLPQIKELLDDAPEDFKVFSGNDDQTLSMMAAGADGVISVASNIAPELVCNMVHAISSMNLSDAERFNNMLLPLYKACFVESNPIPVKAGLSLMGLCEMEMRLPLTPATEKTIEMMKSAMEGL